MGTATEGGNIVGTAVGNLAGGLAERQFAPSLVSASERSRANVLGGLSQTASEPVISTARGLQSRTFNTLGTPVRWTLEQLGAGMLTAQTFGDISFSEARTLVQGNRTRINPETGEMEIIPWWESGVGGVSYGQTVVGAAQRIIPGEQGTENINWRNRDEVQNYFSDGAAMWVSGAYDLMGTIFMDPLIVGPSKLSKLRIAKFDQPVTQKTINGLKLELDKASRFEASQFDPMLNVMDRNPTAFGISRLYSVKNSAAADNMAGALEYASRIADPVLRRQTQTQVLAAGIGDLDTINYLQSRQSWVSSQIDIQRHKLRVQHNDMFRELSPDEIDGIASTIRTLQDESDFLRTVVGDPERATGITFAMSNRTVSKYKWVEESRAAQAEKLAGSTFVTELKQQAGFKVRVVNWLDPSGRLAESPAGISRLSGQSAMESSRELEAQFRLIGRRLPNTMGEKTGMRVNQLKTTIPTISNSPAVYSFEDLTSYYMTLPTKEAKYAFLKQIDDDATRAFMDASLFRAGVPKTAVQDAAIEVLAKTLARRNQFDKNRIFTDVARKGFFSVDGKTAEAFHYPQFQKYLEKTAAEEGISVQSLMQRINDNPQFSSQMANVYLWSDFEQMYQLFRENRRLTKALMDDVTDVIERSVGIESFESLSKKQQQIIIDEAIDNMERALAGEYKAQTTAGKVGELQEKAQRLTSYYDDAIRGLDTFYSTVWKPVTIASFKYAIRNVTEGYYRSAVALNDLATVMSEPKFQAALDFAGLTRTDIAKKTTRWNTNMGFKAKGKEYRRLLDEQGSAVRVEAAAMDANVALNVQRTSVETVGFREATERVLRVPDPTGAIERSGILDDFFDKSFTTKARGVSVTDSIATGIDAAAGFKGGRSASRRSIDFVQSITNDFISRLKPGEPFSMMGPGGARTGAMKETVEARLNAVHESLASSGKTDLTLKEFNDELGKYGDAGTGTDALKRAAVAPGGVPNAVRLYNEEYFRIYHNLSPEDTVKLYRAPTQDAELTSYFSFDPQIALEFVLYHKRPLVVVEIAIKDLPQPVNLVGFGDEMAMGLNPNSPIKSVKRISAEKAKQIADRAYVQRHMRFVNQTETNPTISGMLIPERRYNLLEVVKPEGGWAKSMSPDNAEKFQKAIDYLYQAKLLKVVERNGSETWSLRRITRGRGAISAQDIEAIATIQDLANIRLVEPRYPNAVLEFEKPLVKNIPTKTSIKPGAYIETVYTQRPLASVKNGTARRFLTLMVDGKIDDAKALLDDIKDVSSFREGIDSFRDKLIKTADDLDEGLTGGKYADWLPDSQVAIIADYQEHLLRLANSLEELSMARAFSAAAWARWDELVRGTNPILVRSGQGYVPNIDANIPDWADGPLGQLAMYESAADTTYAATLASRGRGVNPGNTMIRNARVPATHPKWGEAYAHFVNTDLRGDALAFRMMKGESQEELVAWLMKEDARYYRDSFSLSDDVEELTRFVEARAELVDLVIPAELPGLERGTIAKMIAEGNFNADDALLIPMRYRVEVNGDIMGQVWRKDGFKEAYKRTVSTIFKYIGTLPETTLLRHPFYRSVYRMESRRAVKVAKAQGRDALDPQVVDMIRRTAHRRAQKTLNETLYTIERNTQPAEFMRFVSPFYMAKQNSNRFWLGQAIRNPQLAQLGLLAWNTPNKVFTVLDEDGNLVESSLPFLANERVYLTLPKAIADKLGVEYVTFSKVSSDLITNGTIPLLPDLSGGLVSVAANQLMGRTDIQVALQDLGVPADFIETNVLPYMDTYESGVTSLLPRPAWLNSVLGAMNQTPASWARINLLFEQKTLEWQEKNGKAPNASQLASMLTEAMDQSRRAYAMEAAFSLNSPISTKVTSEMDLMRMQYNRYIKRFGPVEGPLIAEREMGPLKVVYARSSLSDNPAGLFASPRTERNIKKHWDLLRRLRFESDQFEMVGMMMNEGGPEDYSASVNGRFYNMEIDGKPVKSRNTDLPEAERQRQTSAGWAEWIPFKETLTANAELSGVREGTSAWDTLYKPLLDGMRASLEKKYPAWADRSSEMDPKRVLKNLKFIKYVLADEKFMSDIGKRNPIWKATNEWLGIRNSLALQLAQRKQAGLPASLTSGANRDLKNLRDLQANLLINKYPEFSIMYERFLSNDPLDVVEEG